MRKPNSKQWVPKKETRRLMDAFSYYYSLGADRTLAKVCEKFNRTSVWATKVAKQFNWRERVAERDREFLQKSLDNHDERLKLANRQNLQLIQAFRARFAEKLKDNKIPIYASDLDTLAKLERLILGEVTERTEDTTLVSLAKRYLELKRNEPTE